MSSDLRTEVFKNGFTTVLVGLALAVYALLISGVTVSYVEAVSACTTWPTCDGSWMVNVSDTDVLIAMGHRLLSVIVGIGLVSATIWSWLNAVPRKVRLTLTGVVLIYPLQVAVGALTAIHGGSTAISGIHLGIAIAIFMGTMVALLFWLEWETRAVQSAYVSSARQEPTLDGDEDATSVATSTPSLWAYVQLTKPRLMWLLCVVALAGIGLATVSSGVAITWQMVTGTLVGGVLAIGASGTFNHVIERDVDQQMDRTARRPVPAGEVPPRRALLFGVGLALSSMIVFISLVNLVATLLALLAIVFYSIVYTVVLKPNTTQNIVIGGAVGALPALIGWAAVTGSIGVPALVLGTIVFLWTPAHFYNLALVYQRDYQAGGFPMLPIVHGEGVTHRHIVLYLAATLTAVGFLAATVSLGWIFAVISVIFAGVFLTAVVNLYRRQTRPAALVTFHTSNIFLGMIMLVIILETIVF